MAAVAASTSALLPSFSAFENEGSDVAADRMRCTPKPVSADDFCGQGV